MFSQAFEHALRAAVLLREGPLELETHRKELCPSYRWLGGKSPED